MMLVAPARAAPNYVLDAQIEPHWEDRPSNDIVELDAAKAFPWAVEVGDEIDSVTPATGDFVWGSQDELFGFEGTLSQWSGSALLCIRTSPEQERYQYSASDHADDCTFHNTISLQGMAA